MSSQRLQRRSGVALWRQIADRIRTGLDDGLADTSGKLPPEVELATRFGVNRHTVRAAISALVHEGVLETRQGSGTFARRRSRLRYPIGARTRFSAGLEGQVRARDTRLVGHGMELANGPVATALGIAVGSPVARLETLGLADGTPITRATSWFDASRFPEMVDVFRKHGSITAALKEFGVEDYLRNSTAIEARHATEDDMRDLQLSPGAIVIVARAINVATDETPIQFSETHFSADRVELVVNR